MEKKLGTIKVYFLNNPKKIISYLKNIESKEETLDKIRPKIVKMKDEHLFVNTEGDQIDQDLEKETPLQDILDDKDEKKLKIFIVDPASSNQENNQEQENQEKGLTDNQISSLKKEQQVSSDSQNPSEQKEESNENNEGKGGNSTEKNIDQQNSQTNQIESTEKPDENEDSNINPNKDGQTQIIKDQNEPKNETNPENKSTNETHETNPEKNKDSLANGNQGGKEKANVQEQKDNKKDISVQENFETTNEGESKNKENNNQTNNEETQEDKKEENAMHGISKNLDNNIDNTDNKNNSQTNDNSNKIEGNQNPSQDDLNDKLDQKDENKNTVVIYEENNSNTQKKEDSKNQSNAGQSEQNSDKNFEKEHSNEISDKGKNIKEEGEKNDNEKEKNLNSINNEIVNNNPTMEKTEIEQKEITIKKANKNNGQNYNLSIKQKTYYFTAIINQKYSDNLKFTFKRTNGQLIGINISSTIINFEGTICEGYIWNSKLNRVLIIYEVKIPSDISNLLIIIQKKNKEYSCSINTGNSKNLIIIKLKPFNEFKDLGNNIFYDLITEKEKDDYLLNLINYFGKKDVDVKNKFIEMFLKDLIIRPSKKMLDVFSLVNIFDNNFLDINFLPIFLELDKFNFGNSIILNEDIKNKILKSQKFSNLLLL